jgi:N-acetyl-anhydromuramyl-L-alanine amidase AmpD
MVVGAARIHPRRFAAIERGKMATISGIIVHQTGASNAQSTLNSYRMANAHGAHFLIAKDGVIYQTASVLQRTNHVGKLRPRCIAEQACTSAEIIQYKKASDAEIHKLEMRKVVPGRYPSNLDSLGIEMVGISRLPPGLVFPPNATQAKKDYIMGEKAIHEPLTNNQQMSLQYLLRELEETLQIPSTEIHRHPDVSRKNLTEAATATWP